jgi:hypothetical protein
MAEPKLFEGDTYPPIRGAALETDGESLMDLSGADELLFLGVAATIGEVIEGEAEALSSEDAEAKADKASPLGYNWKYVLAAEDTASGSADTYTSYLKVVIDAASTPPKEFWVEGDEFTIHPAPGSKK